MFSLYFIVYIQIYFAVTVINCALSIKSCFLFFFLAIRKKPRPCPAILSLYDLVGEWIHIKESGGGGGGGGDRGEGEGGFSAKSTQWAHVQHGHVT